MQTTVVLLFLVAAVASAQTQLKHEQSSKAQHPQSKAHNQATEDKLRFRAN